MSCHLVQIHVLIATNAVGVVIKINVSQELLEDLYLLAAKTHLYSTQIQINGTLLKQGQSILTRTEQFNW